METDLVLSPTQPKLAHCTAVSDEGWVLQWGNDEQTSFQVICRTPDAFQVLKLENILTEAHQKAQAQLLN